VFSGKYEYSIDDKGRLSIPARFRETMSANHEGKLYVTNLLGGCLIAYPEREWDRVQEKLASHSGMEVRDFQRVFFSGVSECTFDRLGRILIPQSLRNDAGIKKNVVIIGIIKKLEIWAEEAWTDFFQKARGEEEKLQRIAAELGL
jgi:MraZ protein